jgi:hypothetical protein
VAAAAAAALRAEAAALRGEVERALERHSTGAEGAADPELQSRAAEYRSGLRLPPAQAAQRRVRLVSRWEAATMAEEEAGAAAASGGGLLTAAEAEGPVVLLRRFAATEGTDADIEGREDAQLQAGGLPLAALTVAPAVAAAAAAAAAASAAETTAAAAGSGGGLTLPDDETAASPGGPAVAAIRATTTRPLEVTYGAPAGAAAAA